MPTYTDWRKLAWKAIKTAGVSAVSIAATAFASSLLEHVDTAAELERLALPVVYVPIVLAGVTACRSWLKSRGFIPRG